MDKPLTPVELGQEMWAGLCKTHKELMDEHGFVSQQQKAQVWAGFLAGASGAMGSDLGNDAKIVFSACQDALNTVLASTSPVS